MKIRLLLAATLLCLALPLAAAEEPSPVSYTHLTLPTSDLV